MRSKRKIYISRRVWGRWKVEDDKYCVVWKSVQMIYTSYQLIRKLKGSVQTILCCEHHNGRTTSFPMITTAIKHRMMLTKLRGILEANEGVREK